MRGWSGGGLRDSKWANVCALDLLLGMNVAVWTRHKYEILCMLVFLSWVEHHRSYFENGGIKPKIRQYIFKLWYQTK